MGAMSVVKGIVAIVVGAALAYFWSTLRPDDAFEILFGVGAIAAIAAFVAFHFMGRS